MNIIDEFLPEDEFKPIQDKILGSKFEWCYNSSIANQKEGLNQFQFIHDFFTTRNPYLDRPISKYHKLIRPILFKLQPMHLLRVKANLRPRTSKHVYSDMHIDLNMNQLTAIFYFNTSNGWTEFEDGTKIDSIANRMLIFDGDLMHCGTSPTDTQIRALLNINYIPGITNEGIPYIPTS